MLTMLAKPRLQSLGRDLDDGENVNMPSAVSTVVFASLLKTFCQVADSSSRFRKQNKPSLKSQDIFGAAGTKRRKQIVDMVHKQWIDFAIMLVACVYSCINSLGHKLCKLIRTNMQSHWYLSLYIVCTHFGKCKRCSGDCQPLNHIASRLAGDGGKPILARVARMRSPIRTQLLWQQHACKNPDSLSTLSRERAI